LRSGSPAIDAGIPVASAKHDFEDTLRPQRSAYDIGAFEHADSTWKEENGISIIPEPANAKRYPGYFVLPQHVVIEINSNLSIVKNIALQLSERISASSGYRTSIDESGRHVPRAICLWLNAATDTTTGDEGYSLIVTTGSIFIRANRPAGLFYGMQSLLQLFPKEVESSTVVSKIAWRIPAVKIKDCPRFKWRGIMLDVARHFFTKKEVKQFIDNMVKYKFNLLHLHLTDDEGWRIEIKSLPRLTEIGSFRVNREHWNYAYDPTLNEPKTYGGFYTQGDIKELVQYARERFVDILPEIEIPGHSMAAIASYSDLSCTRGEYHVHSGEDFEKFVNGHVITTIDNNLCPANEKVYDFLDKVFTEVSQLFPFEYIHIGGDECAKNLWEKSDAIKDLMQKNGLKTMDEVQAYFTKRAEKIIASKGKKLIGWDEILEGGLSPDAAVMSWRGMDGGIAAASTNHNVVMVPNDYTYVDLYQGDSVVEPHTYGMLRLQKAYEFDPLPAGINPRYILGGECALWTEEVATKRHAEYMLWSRAFATAESLWSFPDKKNWVNFVGRVEKQFQRLDISETNYSRSMYDPVFKAVRGTDNSLMIQIHTEIKGLDIYYSFDETIPDPFYPKYQNSLSIPKGAVGLKVITYRNNKPVGRLITMPVAILEKRAEK
jgi:hexosaminidase